MGLLYAHGSVNWLAADVATTTYVVSGLGFQPKAIMFCWMGLGGTTDAASQTVHMRKGIGFAVSSSTRVAMGSQSQDAAGTQVCTTGYRNDAVAVTMTSTPAVDGLLDLQSIDSEGFTLVVDDQGVVDISVMWQAWGGDGITAANIMEISEPAATGNVDYDCGCTPTCLILAGVQGTAAANTVTRNDAALMVGCATSPDASNQWVVVSNDDDGSATSDTDGYARSGECLSLITVAGGNPSSRAVLVSFLPRGFRLNWIALATTSRRYVALTLEGGQFQAGSLTIAGNSASSTTTVGGLPFRPIGLMCAGMMRTESVAATSTTEDRMAVGWGSSTSSRRSQGSWSENGNATAAEIDLTLSFDQILSYPSNAGAELTAYDIDLMDKDSFRLITDVAGGVASEWIGYLTFGGKSPVLLNNYMQPTAIGLSGGERIR